MNTDLDLVLRYAPKLHFDRNEPIRLRAVGYTVFTETARSRSFPNRTVEVPEEADFVIEYAYYFDYDIEHMYDLEHIWVTAGKDGAVSAQGSFHGKYLNLTGTGIPGSLSPDGTHVHAFCQPGKHAMLAAGELTRLYPGWDTCCGIKAGGPVLIGAPFSKVYAGIDLFVPEKSDDMHSIRYIREALAFTPGLVLEERSADWIYMPWEDLFQQIPGWIETECRRLDSLYGKD